MTYTSYSSLNTLEDTSFIGGNTFYLDFNVYDDNGVMIDLSGKSLEWKLAPYGQKNINILIKTETPYVSGGVTYGGGVTDFDIYTKRVTLDSSDTESLSGKYVQQVVVIEILPDTTVITYKPSQGVITILSDIYKP